MKNWRLDLVHSVRSLTKNPGYSSVAILLFAVGIGANTAIFSVADAVLLKPLPYADPDRLVVTLHQGVAPVSPADFLDYQKSVKAFDHLGAAQMWRGTVAFGDRSDQIPGLQITRNVIDLLGVPPMLGRGFTDSTDDHTVLLSYGLWKDRFGGDDAIIGRAVSIDRVPFTVAGVMPPSFRFAPFWATQAQMWVPLNLANRIDDRDGRSLRVFGRLRRGVTLQQAQAEMDAVAAHLAEEYPKTNAKLTIQVVPLHEKVVGSVRPTLLALLGTVGFVLLIACATVGNLMLSRSVGRRREMALRMAVGAQCADLVRVIMSEVLVLATLGAVGGLLLGRAAVAILGELLPAGSMPRQAEVTFSGGPALLFGAVAALLSAVIAGILPSIQATRANLNLDLKAGGRGTTSSGGRKLRSQSALIAAEVALSLLLMAGAGLMMRTMMALTSLDAGFDPQRLLTLQVSVRGTDYDQPGRRGNILREVREHLESSPEVASVSAVNHLPVGGDMWNIGYTIEGRPLPLPGEGVSAVYRVAMPGYLSTMRIGLLEGRDFTDQDGPVALINETMAKHQWPNGESPIGKVLHYGLSDDERKIGRTIVGVVRTTRQTDWTSQPQDEVYLPYYQRADSMGLSSLAFVIRTRGSAEAIVRDLRSFNKSLTLSDIALMDQIISDQLWRPRLVATLMGAFAVVALLLAAAGIYGVISHSMRQRAQEIGIRMALGAKSRDLIQLTLLEGMKPVILGLIAGLASALSLTRFLQSMLYGVDARDVSTFGWITALLVAVSIAANLLPAFRATRVDPVQALREG